MKTLYQFFSQLVSFHEADQFFNLSGISKEVEAINFSVEELELSSVYFSIPKQTIYANWCKFIENQNVISWKP